MWKKVSGSLTARIFLLTCALLIAISAVTYGMIAYLTPISYTTLLEDDLRAQVDTLLDALSQTDLAGGEALLSEFVRQTGADLLAMTDDGRVLLNTFPQPVAEAGTAAETSLVQSDVAGAVQSDISVITQEVIVVEDSVPSGSVSQAVSSVEGTATAVMPTMDQAEAATRLYFFTFADGTAATLTVEGGFRAVNQATEAIGRVLPYLVCAILLLSLAASFLYARFITRPIVSISGIARRLSKLDFTARWQTPRGDEIGALGESLNLLSDNLSQALDGLSEANRRLQSDIDRERALERQRMAFFAAASHELKTPITILKGQLSGMLAQVGIYRDREKYLARALAVTGRMESLVKEILTINRIESAGFSLGKKPVDLAALIEAQLSMDAELIEQKGLTLHTDLRPGSAVLGDASLLSAAIDNVLINAILYSPPGASIYAAAHGNAFSIENTGASIPEASLSQLLTPFYRVEQSRNRKSGGSGLGLYLVKSILDLHGAACAIENTPRGVLFSATFPPEPEPTDDSQKGNA